MDAQGYFLDNISFDQQTVDKGYARIPNGTGPFVIQEPTFNTFNETVPTLEPEAFTINELRVSPNPASETLNIELVGGIIEGNLLVTDAMGQTIIQTSALSNQTLFVADWPKGIYFLKWANLAAKIVIQ